MTTIRDRFNARQRGKCQREPRAIDDDYDYYANRVTRMMNEMDYSEEELCDYNSHKVIEMEFEQAFTELGLAGVMLELYYCKQPWESTSKMGDQDVTQYGCDYEFEFFEISDMGCDINLDSRKGPVVSKKIVDTCYRSLIRLAREVIDTEQVLEKG